MHTTEPAVKTDVRSSALGDERQTGGGEGSRRAAPRAALSAGNRKVCRETDEWLEADGLGGFASGTSLGMRTRRYHALLLTATTPPTGRYLLVNGIEVEAVTSAGNCMLSVQRYDPDVITPERRPRVESFAHEPWPSWRFRLPDGSCLVHEVFVPREKACVVLSWRLERAAEAPAGAQPVTLRVRPLLSGRDYHALHHANPDFCFDAHGLARGVSWRPYPGVPGVQALFEGTYSAAPEWYRRFAYAQERARGFDATEDLASPGAIEMPVGAEPAVLVFAAEGVPGALTAAELDRGAPALAETWSAAERLRRAQEASRGERHASAYLARREDGRTVVAGYPWFTDWGRDTFIALRGLCLATKRFEEAKQVLLRWAGAVSEGMLPNRFPDFGGEAEFNSVDASLWYCVAAGELLDATKTRRAHVTEDERAAIRDAVLAIVAGYARGTRFGIRMDDDGLLRAGVPGWQLTWMDARVGDRVITPRIGKPVEIQALWLHALGIASAWQERWEEVLQRGREAFRARFWDAGRRTLADVVDVDHRAGTADWTVRPNQIFAVGGLPTMLLEMDEARQVVETVERRLWTPIGLRSLAPDEPGYCPRYEGGPESRDAAYHQGTVWPWLIGAFVEAWVRVRGGTAEAKREARRRFLAPLLEHLESAGLGHVSEISDGDEPNTPRGCPFQAWSMGELLRLELVVLGTNAADIEVE